MASLTFFFGLAPEVKFPEGEPPWHFMLAVGPTGFMTFVKVVELLGGLLVIVPRTRNLGLLFLGPVIVNIIAYHLFVMGGEGVFHPMVIAIALLAAYLLWAERKSWAALVAPNRVAQPSVE